MTQQINKKIDNSDPPWWYLLIAAFFTGGAVYLYFFFTELETKGGRRTINWVIALMYEIGGKWTVITFVLILVVFLLHLAITEYKKRQSWR